MAIKVGFIGCGGVAYMKHLPGLKPEKDVEMVAFCDIVKERAQKAAKEYGTPDATLKTPQASVSKSERNALAASLAYIKSRTCCPVFTMTGSPFSAALISDGKKRSGCSPGPNG